MKIIAYLDDASEALGLMVGDHRFAPLAEFAPDLPSNLVALLEAPDGLDRLRAAAPKAVASRSIEDVRLLPFVGRANALWALALNFKSHIEETGLPTSRDYPHIFLRTAASYVGANEPILAPAESVARAFDYEGELGVVIGKPGRFIPPEQALEHVAGYTCLNEGSVREYQMHNRQFGLGKNFEGSGSYGPWLMTSDEFGDPAQSRVRTRINGVVRQDAPLNDMLFDVAAVVSYLSQGYTLRPGDLIAMGTPGALKPQPDDVEGQDLTRQFGPFPTPGLVHMHPGDTVEIEIDGLGVLRNPVRADAAPQAGAA
jgi:2-keto-4-pentenoate hydratase/2-oxohepta-3-ene-1,7-dioic acid hydratase in catechol pathway